MRRCWTWTLARTRTSHRPTHPSAASPAAWASRPASSAPSSAWCARPAAGGPRPARRARAPEPARLSRRARRRPRRTRRASARGPTRPRSLATWRTTCAALAPSTARRPGGRGASAGWTSPRCATPRGARAGLRRAPPVCAPPASAPRLTPRARQDKRLHRAQPDQAGRAVGAGDHPAGRGLPLRRARPAQRAGRPGHAGARGGRVRGAARLAVRHLRGARACRAAVLPLDAAARAGPQCSPDCWLRFKAAASYARLPACATCIPLWACSRGSAAPSPRRPRCAQVRHWDDLPKAAREYIARIEALVGVPCKWIGVGPGRDAIVSQPVAAYARR